MQCIHIVKVTPEVLDNYIDDEYTNYRFHRWLGDNNISRYRGGHCNPNTFDNVVVFRFADSVDAMSFKMRWG